MTGKKRFIPYILFILYLFPSFISLKARERDALYRPPSSDTWQTIHPAEAGWNMQLLRDAMEYARENTSSGILILYRGKILVEEYWDAPGLNATPIYEGLTTSTADRRPLEDVASIQKSIISLLIGAACDRGLLNLHEPANSYIEPGWSDVPSEIENTITIAHLLSMTSGIDVSLGYKNIPGMVWQYNTAAYNILMRILEKVTAKSLQELSVDWLFDPLAITESYWIRRPDSLGRYPMRFIATHRDLAKLGQLIIAGGQYGNQTVYLQQGCMKTAFRPSQEINIQYGHLFWLNTHQQRNPYAPANLIEMVGAKERFVSILPEQDIVVVRLGEEPRTDFYLNFWSLLQKAMP